MANCKSCQAEIGWAKDPAGKRVPVDAGEREDGNVAVREQAGGTLAARYLRGDNAPADGERRTVSHFATCPDSAGWRDRGRGPAGLPGVETGRLPLEVDTDRAS